VLPLIRKPRHPTQLKRIFTSNDSLLAVFDTLGFGDFFIGRVRLKASEEMMLLDMVARGVGFYPSATAQIASRSKVFQARLFSRFMIPHTLAVHDRHDLLTAINKYNEMGIKQVVTKEDRRNAGMGIHLWSSLEEVYNVSAYAGMAYPFVVQPFVADSRDIRVIILDDYEEAYQRRSPHNFRNNLHCGGISEPYALKDEERQLCRAVMSRADFPYGHIDLMITGEGEVYLAEINLRGGIKGARISTHEYCERVGAIHKKFEMMLRDRA